MPTKQTKTKPAAPRPERTITKPSAPAAVQPPTAPQSPAAPPRPYGSDGLLRVRRLLARASDESQEFFEELMSKWDKSTRGLAQTALAASARALGCNHLAVEAEDMQNSQELKNIDTVAKIFTDGKWVSHFVAQLCHGYRDDTPSFDTPESTLFILEQEMEYFDNELESARGVLRDHPEVLTAELHGLAKERPDLFKPSAPAA